MVCEVKILNDDDVRGSAVPSPAVMGWWCAAVLCAAPCRTWRICCSGAGFEVDRMALRHLRDPAHV